MKQSILSNGHRFKNFFQFFKKEKLNEGKVLSIEELKDEITSINYEKRLKTLLKEDLGHLYDKATLEAVFENLSVLIYENFPDDQLIVEEPETVIDQKEIDAEALESNFMLDGEKKNEVAKIENRIPKWFRNPHQINTLILISFMELLGDNNSVPLHKLEAACRSIKTFQSNYTQMKIIAERNHAKVFEEAGNQINLWEPVREFVKKEYSKYLQKKNN